MDRSVDSAGRLERLRQEFVDAQVQLGAASDSLAEIAIRSRHAVEVGIGHISAGLPVSDLPTAAGLADLRASINQVFADFDAARMRTRAYAMILAAAEGMSQAEVARQWGVSRQYVSRVIADHPELAAPDGEA